ncbi:dipeptidyl peptidase 2-like [Argiope bruennichi]|uniref:dipeptidyl peptidase 2-like n=1 Tax=Argiope bruennichi TaxID=94029 RepID=UPI002494A65D|nr:dipeptidyl peptidase 2-like [Argiope bruennichi]
MYILYTLTLCLILIGQSYAEDYDYYEGYFDQKIDHFNFLSHGNQTYKQRYLFNATWWDVGRGPIFFYAGNEGDVVGFWKNTGFIFKAAKQFNALVLFAEHRYYGKSLPFGNDSFKGENIGLLSVNQAVSDYAFILKRFKETHKADKCPIIAFGGSYGGMLAAYMRFKYPNIIHGAIAASAPLYQVAGKVPGDVFFQAVTKDFHDISPDCEAQVRSAFSQVDKWAAMGQAGYEEIARTFRLCKPLNSAQDYQHLLRWARNAFVSAAMMDYPYAASFMGNFPAFPVKVMCNRLQSASRPADGLCQAVALYYNASETVECFDIYQEYIYCADPTGCGLGFDATAWDYQACTEINLEGSTSGTVDMFPVLPFTSQMRDEYCYKTYKVLPRRDYLDVQYWGADISSSSNIVFSNGNLDPWAPGGILKNISDSLVAVIVDGGAHHLDLREDNPNDPPSVRTARDFELANIGKWLQSYYENLYQ